MELWFPLESFSTRDLQRKQPLLVDLKDGIDAAALDYKERLIEEIWVIVDGVNKKYWEKAWVRKECIIISEPQKPIPRNQKVLFNELELWNRMQKKLESL